MKKKESKPQPPSKVKVVESHSIYKSLFAASLGLYAIILFFDAYKEKIGPVDTNTINYTLLIAILPLSVLIAWKERVFVVGFFSDIFSDKDIEEDDELFSIKAVITFFIKLFLSFKRIFLLLFLSIAMKEIFWLNIVVINVIYDYWIGSKRFIRIAYTTIFTSCSILIIMISLFALDNQTLPQYQKRDSLIGALLLTIVMLVMFYKGYINQKFNKFALIKASIAIYLCVGLLFACAYNFLYDSTSFKGVQNISIKGGYTISGMDIAYFSFVTLATTGYGDISPNNNMFKIMSILENIIGVVIVGVILASAVAFTQENRRNL